MKKRLWAAALAAAVAVTSVTVAPHDGRQVAIAAPQTGSNAEVEDTSVDSRTTAGGFTFSITGSEATITGYSGTAKELAIPTKIKVTKPGADGSTQKPDDSTAIEYAVTAIGDNAFSGNLGITSVTVSGGTDSDGKVFGIRKIGEKAFFACHDLSKVSIASTTTSIGDYAFSDCLALSSITVSEGNQRYKVIDNALYYYTAGTGTGTYALVQYPIANAAKEYKVPELVAPTLTEIGKGAFWGSQSLETIELPSAVKKIGNSAFAQCRMLKSVSIPAGVTEIGEEAFRGDISLAEIAVPDGVTIINAGTFQGCEALKSVKMPDDLKIIANRAFQGCKALTEFVVPPQVTTLGDQAFAQCEALRQITVPMKTTSIGNGVFTGTAVTVLCHNGSQAAVYAGKNGLTAERTYTVAFYTNSTYTNLISSQEVAEGKDAVPPAVPGRDGYRMSWSGSYTAIRQDTRVYEVWDKQFNVTFIDKFNGKTEVVQVDEGKVVNPPAWSMPGYELSWDTDITDFVYADFTARAVWRSTSTGKVVDKDAVKPAAKGTDLKAGNNLYKVNSKSAGNPTVKFVGLSDANVSTVKIPETISAGGVRYKVTAISAKAVAGNKNVRELIINKNVTSISAKAFFECKNLKKVKIKSKSITKMNNKAFGKIHSKAKFYTYNSQIARYKSMLKNAGVKKPTVKKL